MERLKSMSCEQKLWDILLVYFMTTNVSNKQHTRRANHPSCCRLPSKTTERPGTSFFFFLNKMVCLSPPPRIGSNSIPSDIMSWAQNTKSIYSVLRISCERWFKENPYQVADSRGNGAGWCCLADWVSPGSPEGRLLCPLPGCQSPRECQ